MKIIKSLIGVKANSRFSEKSEKGVSILSKLEDLITQYPDIEEKVILEKLGIRTRGQFQTIKHRLESKLINDIFLLTNRMELIDIRIYSKPLVAKLYTVGILLLKNSERTTGNAILEKCLNYAIKFEFSDIISNISSSFMFHYGIYELNNVKLAQYAKLFNDNSFKYFQEGILTTHYVFVTNMLLKNTGKLSKIDSNEIGNRLQSMMDINEKIDTYTTQLYTYEVTYDYLIAIADYKGALELGMNKRDIFAKKYSDERLLSFSVHKNIGVAYFYSGNFEEAYHYFQYCIDFTTPRTRYWTYMTSFQFMNFMHLGRLEEALELTIKAIENKYTKDFTLYYELWKIREAFMHFLIKSGKVCPSPEQLDRLRPFAISKFLNNVPFYSKDKAGQQINIIILQILFLLLNRKYGQVIDRKDALTKYTQRYIVKNNYYRAQCFINMILIAIKSNFHPTRTRNLTDKLYTKLKKEIVTLNDNEPMIEIVPYNLLWELVLEILDQNNA